MRTTETPASACPSCGATLDAAASPVEESPRPGDYSVCFECAAPLRYTDDMGLRLLTLGEVDRMEPDTSAQLQSLRDMIREHRRIVRLQEAMQDALRHERREPPAADSTG